MQPQVADPAPSLTVQGLTKSFGARQVLTDVDLTVARGSVHALVGHNGSGKSTIVKILAGYHERDAGDIRIGGVEVPPDSAANRIAQLGVRVVHQDLALIDGLSVLENVAVASGFERSAAGTIRWRATERRVKAALELIGLGDLNPQIEIDVLPVWQRVAVACARALYDGLEVVRLLILDEVTAALPRGEVVMVLEIIRRLQALGAGILYVTHRFEEVLEIADTVTVMRDGHVIADLPMAGLTEAELVELVVGHPIEKKSRAGSARSFGPVMLEVDDLTSDSLHGVSLTVRGGEVVGVIGRAGCGRSAVGRTIYGQQKHTSGSMRVAGEPWSGTNPTEAMRRGFAYVPQDRQRSGVLPDATVRENFTITNLGEVSNPWGWIRSGREKKRARGLVERYDVLPADIEATIENLSGGNQQKVVVGRWATRTNRVFVLDEPTEGVDAAARQSIYAFIAECAADGAAVLLLSSSVEEIVENCDRVILMAEGSIAAEVAGADMTIKGLERMLMLGVRPGPGSPASKETVDK